MKETISRFDFSDFWSMTMEEMIQVVPENKMVLILQNNQYSEKQIEVLNQLEDSGFKIEKLESTLTEKNEKVEQEAISSYKKHEINKNTSNEEQVEYSYDH